MQNVTDHTQSSSYNGAIDFWKFIFCLVILFFHVGEAFGENDYPFRYGMYAVEFFFVVSGYLMCISASKVPEQTGISLGRETLGFVLHKVKAILSPYLLAFALSWANWYTFTGKTRIAEKGFDAFFRSNLNMLPDFLLFYMAGYDGTVVIRITWYISAMLIAMLILYPLLRRFKDMYLFVIAPLLVFFLCGYLANTTTYNGIMKYEGFTTHGVIRAIIGLCLGSVVYCFSQYIQKQKFTTLSRVLLFLAEFGGYFIILYLMYSGKEENAYIILIFLLFAVSITASRQAVTARLFDNRLCRFLGRFSLYIYLFQSPARMRIRKLYPDYTYAQGLLHITLLTFFYALLAFLVITLLSRYAKKIGSRLRPLFLS